MPKLRSLRGWVRLAVVVVTMLVLTLLAGALGLDTAPAAVVGVLAGGILVGLYDGLIAGA